MKLLLIIIVFISLKIWELLFAIVCRPIRWSIKMLKNKHNKDENIDFAWTILMTFIYPLPLYYYTIPWVEGSSTIIRIVVSAAIGSSSIWIAVTIIFCIILIPNILPKFIKKNWEAAKRIVEKK